MSNEYKNNFSVGKSKIPKNLSSSSKSKSENSQNKNKNTKISTSKIDQYIYKNDFQIDENNEISIGQINPNNSTSQLEELGLGEVVSRNSEVDNENQHNENQHNIVNPENIVNFDENQDDLYEISDQNNLVVEGETFESAFADNRGFELRLFLGVYFDIKNMGIWCDFLEFFA